MKGEDLEESILGWCRGGVDAVIHGAHPPNDMGLPSQELCLLGHHCILEDDVIFRAVAISGIHPAVLQSDLSATLVVDDGDQERLG